MGAVTTPEVSGVLILRAWIEGDPSIGLRARLTGLIDNASPEYSMRTAAAIDDICAGVRSWLEDLVSLGASKPPSPRR